MMKSIITLFLVFYLLRDANIICARKDQGEYWENIMMGQHMPEAIQDLIQDPRVSDSSNDRFSRDFDIKPNVILYHTNHMSRNQNPVFVKNREPEFEHQPDAIAEQSIKKG